MGSSNFRQSLGAFFDESGVEAEMGIGVNIIIIVIAILINLYYYFIITIIYEMTTKEGENRNRSVVISPDDLTCGRERRRTQEDERRGRADVHVIRVS
jgi:hypothetical protein